MKIVALVCVLFAAVSAAPSGYGSGMKYGDHFMQMQPAGSPPVHMVPNNSYGSSSVTYTAPGQTYRAAPVTYAAPMITFQPPPLTYSGQSVTYATAASGGYGSGSQSYQPASSYSAPAHPTVQNYQPSYSGGY